MATQLVPDACFAVLGRNSDAAVRLANLATLGSVQSNRFTRVSALVSDLGDVAQSSEVIAHFKPDVIFNTASIQPWYKLSELEAGKNERISAAHFGPWLPMHLAPALQLMRAVRDSGVNSVVVNAAFPDAVNPALKTRGLSPTYGIGNVANSIPALTLGAADLTGLQPADITVRMLAYHYVSHRLSRSGNTGTSPYHLEVTDKAGQTINTPSFDAELFALCQREYRRLGGRTGQDMTALSAMSVLGALLGGRPRLVHSPGFLGLPGAYPVELSQWCGQLSLPTAVSAGQARAINELSGQSDGIDGISDQGVISFTEESSDVMREELGFDCPQFTVDDVIEVAAELKTLYDEYAVERD
ncbi:MULTISPECIES: hypothetical protein [unclassified Curtobacterium]|nr:MULTISPECIES: hypothetical protein [unclassified Curtobacterium]